MRSAEIVIIGGGIVGASVACHLVERGARDILVLEREPWQGTGSTGKATGGVRSQFETEINIRLSKYSIDFFRDWDHDCGYEPRGYLFFTCDEKHLEYLTSNVGTQRRLGVKGVDLVGREEIREIVPGICVDDVVGGTFGRGDGV